MVDPEHIIAFARGVAKAFRPDRIVLFGSYAYGTPNEDSDVDLLVVMPSEGLNHHQAARIRQAIDADFPMDLIVRADDEIRQRIEWNDFFLKEITEQGIALYAADDAGVGAKGRRRLRRRHTAPALAKAQPS